MLLSSKNIWDDLLDKKSGYELKNVIATTFTLSTDIIPSLLLKIIECDKGLESVSKLTREEKYLLLSANIEESSKKLTIFSDDYLIPSYNRSTEYQRLINEYCIPNIVTRVAPKNDGSNKCYFHPKIVIVHYQKADSNENYLKCAVLSKNLTLSKYVVEIGAVFESVKCIGEGDVEVKEASKRISSLFDTLFLKENSILRSDDELKGISLSREEAYKKVSVTIEAMKEMSFRLCIGSGSKKPMSAELLIGMPQKGLLNEDLRKDLESASYWCSDSISASFMKTYKCKHMISNLRSFSNLFNKTKNEAAFRQKDIIPDNYYITMDETETPMTVHAKCLESFHDGNKFTLLGSANFTEQAFLYNYECILRLTYACENDEKQNECIYDIDKRVLHHAFNIYNRKTKKRRVKDVFSLLQDENLKQDFEKKLQQIQWTITIEAKKMEINGIANDLKISEEEEKWISSMEVVLSGKRLTLELRKHENGVTEYSASCDNFKVNMIPWYGFMNLVYFKAYNDAKVVPVKVDLIMVEECKQKCQQSVMTKDCVADILLGGKIFRLRNVIPPEPKGKLSLYSSEDSVDVRQAKYLTKGGSIQTIIQNIDMIKDKMKVVDFDEEDDFSETTQGISDETIKALKERFDQYSALLSKQNKQESGVDNE